MPRIGKCRAQHLPTPCFALELFIDVLTASTIVWTTTGLAIDMAEIPIQEVSRRRFTHSRCLAQRFASFLPVAGEAFSRSRTVIHKHAGRDGAPRQLANLPRTLMNLQPFPPGALPSGQRRRFVGLEGVGKLPFLGTPVQPLLVAAHHDFRGS